MKQGLSILPIRKQSTEECGNGNVGSCAADTRKKNTMEMTYPQEYFLMPPTATTKYFPSIAIGQKK